MAIITWTLKSIALLGIFLIILTTIILAPGIVFPHRIHMTYNDGLTFIYKIKRPQLPIIEILPVPTASVLSTQTSLDDIMDSTENSNVDQQLSDWFRRNEKTQPEEALDHSKHSFFKKFIIPNKGICQHTKVDILIYIQSSPENYERRGAIRETWGNRAVFTDISLKTVFVLGRPNGKANNNKLQALISNENVRYNDIIQVDFLDTFKNLTIKSISILRWIYQFCPHAKYILKADDDIYVNVFQLVEKLISQIWQKDKAVVCHYKSKGTSPIIRSPSSKWYVPADILKGEKYFPFGFCSGYAVLFTSNLVPIMYKNSFQVPYNIVDDVYVFGFLLQNTKNISYVNAQQNFTLNQKDALSEYEGSHPITHIVASSWAKNSMERYWYATINKLSSWARLHSALNTKWIPVDNKMNK